MIFMRAWVIACVALALLGGALAEENSTDQTITENQTSIDNQTAPVNETGDDNQTAPVNETAPASQALNETVQDTPENVTANVTAPLPIEAFDISDFSPNEAETGDTSLDVTIKNTGTVLLKNILPTVSGRGFSTYDVSPIPLLAPGEEKISYVVGHFSEEGSILLTVRINDKVFYEKVAVRGKVSTVNETKLAEIEAAKQAALDTLSQELAGLKHQYKALEDEKDAKEKSYDIDDVSLADLKENLRQAEAAILTRDPMQANTTIALARSEYADQKENLDNAPEKSFGTRIEGNIMLISTIAGLIVTMVTLFEIMRRNKDDLYKKVKEIKINEDTKIVVKKKRPQKKEKSKE